MRIVGTNIRRLGLFANALLRADASHGTRPLLLALAGAVFEGAGLMLLMPIIAVLTQSSAGDRSSSGRMTGWLIDRLPEGRLAQLATLLALFGTLMVLRAVIGTARDVSFARLNATFAERTRGDLLDRLVRAGWARIAGLHHARITHLLSADFQTCAVAGTSFVNLCLSGILLIVLLIVALLISPLLATSALLFLLGFGAILYRSLGSARRTGIALGQLGAMLTSDLGQLLAGLKPALGNNLGREMLAHIAELQRAQSDQMVRFAQEQSRSRAATALAGGVMGAATMLVGGLALGVEGARLLAMLAIFARIHGPALQFQQSAQLLLHTLPTYERIKALEDDLPPIAELAADTPSARFPAGPVTLEAVTYLHASQEASGGGVRELDLTLEQGSRTAIIGVSGAGKTTLADLLAGLIAPQSGAISLGGTLLTPENVGQWQRDIAYVPQDSFLLNDTIRSNLLWGNPEATVEDLQAALRTVGAADFIDARPQRLDAMVGERGILLSGGERQRIVLARALLRRPRLIILDEATNALDSETEERVLAGIAALPDKPTIIAISHRGAALDSFDRIYQMSGGRLLPDDNAAGRSGSGKRAMIAKSDALRQPTTSSSPARSQTCADSSLPDSNPAP